MNTIELSSTRAGRVSGIFWLGVWMLIVVGALLALNDYVANAYADHDVSSYEEFQREAYSDEETPVFFARMGRAVCVLVLLALVWDWLATFFAWRAKLSVETDKDGYATIITKTWSSFPRGGGTWILPVNRITDITARQSTIERFLGIGTISIEVQTFVLKAATQHTVTLNGVADPLETAEQLKPTIQPHEGLLLAVRPVVEDDSVL